jgi:hypothetical protein
MMQFAEAVPDEAIVATLSRQLSWSHLKELLPLARAAHFLGWEPAVVNVQYLIEGSSTGSGSVTSYMHKLTISRC